ncbi:hypothetical protein ETD85_41515 [Nonomuraea zeae]|uniref:Uncharacterized protein n=1 Tax=Nonomuraea zeae TaxID=1642303 RepID=A0A5S4G2V8_9ACTN|nr:hypothetical protein ETD85_41515 [Nonomuraea zeae]
MATVTACSEPPPPVPAPGAEARELSVPFDRYNFSPADISLLESAEDLLVRDCMRGRGMAWEPLPPAVASDLEPPNRRRYGVVEPEVARLYGYHVAPDRPSVARRAAARESRAAHLPEKERQAVYDETGGCLRKARDRIEQGAPQVDTALFNKLITQTFEQSRRDVKVVQTFRSWSACMRAEGLRYADPLAAVTDQRWQGEGPPTEEEIRAAQADVRCKAKTALVSVWSAAEERIQGEVVRAHPEEFEALKAAKDRQSEAARAIIAGAR